MYHVGDRVLIKPDAKEMYRDWLGFADQMEKYCGTERTVTGLYNSSKHIAYYLSDCCDDGTQWVWCEEWLEDASNYDINENEIINLFGE